MENGHKANVIRTCSDPVGPIWTWNAVINMLYALCHRIVKINPYLFTNVLNSCILFFDVTTCFCCYNFHVQCVAGDNLHCTPLDRPFKARVLEHYPEAVANSSFDHEAVCMVGFYFLVYQHWLNIVQYMIHQKLYS